MKEGGRVRVPKEAGVASVSAPAMTPAPLPPCSTVFGAQGSDPVALTASMASGSSGYGETVVDGRVGGNWGGVLTPAAPPLQGHHKQGII